MFRTSKPLNGQFSTAEGSKLQSYPSQIRPLIGLYGELTVQKVETCYMKHPVLTQESLTV